MSDSAAIQQFRSLFVVRYTPRVFLINESHGHVGMDAYMVRVLLVGSTQSHLPSVNADQISVKQQTPNGDLALREQKGHGTTAGRFSTPRRK